MNSNNTDRSITLYVALFMHICAIGYLASVHFNVVIKHNIPWDSDLGTLMMVIPVMLILYSWTMLLNMYLSGFQLTQSQVMDNEGHWRAKDVHWPHPHPNSLRE